MKENIKDLMFSLWNKGIVRILLVVLLFVVAASLWFGTRPTTNDGRFGKITYPVTIEGTQKPTGTIQINFNPDLQKLRLPQELYVYSLKSQNEDETIRIFKKTASLLGLPTEGSISAGLNYKIWSSNNKSGFFEGNILTGSFSFSGESTYTLTFKTNERLVSEARQFFKNIDIDMENTTPSVKYLKLSGMEYEPTGNGGTADLVQVLFVQTTQGYKIKGVGLNSPNINIMIGLKDGKVKGLNYFGISIDQNIKSKYNVLTLSELQKNIFELLTFTDLYDKSGDNLPLEEAGDIKSVDINLIEIEYLSAYEEQSLLKPVFRISGEVGFENGDAGTFEAIAPAVSN